MANKKGPSNLGPAWDAMERALEPIAKRYARGQPISRVGINVNDAKVEGKFDPRTGNFRDKGKPNRCLVHLRYSGDRLVASYPPGEGRHTLGYSNIGLSPLMLAFVVVPALPAAPRLYRLHVEWKWMLVFVFPKPVVVPPRFQGPSPSGPPYSFDPGTGRLRAHKEPGSQELPPNPRYLEEEDAFVLPYVEAALVKLLPDDAKLQIPDHGGKQATVTYAQATAAIAEFLRTDPLRFPEVK